MRRTKVPSGRRDLPPSARASGFDLGSRLGLRSVRPGITLLEVLIALFIMAIGLLTILTLFPLGALSMAQSLQSDRAATAAHVAAESAEAMNLLHDPNVTAAFTSPPPGFAPPPDDDSGPSWPVFVDGFARGSNFSPLGASPLSPGIARVQPTYATTPALAARWFTLPDDLTFGPDAVPSGGVQRGGRYTWTYLLRRPRSKTPSVVDLTILVYSGRDTQAGTGETPYAASGRQGESTLVLTYVAAQGKPALRQNGRVLDVTYDRVTKRTRAQCYRVINVGDANATTVTLEVDPPLHADVNTVVVLANVIEVIPRGLTRAP